MAQLTPIYDLVLLLSTSVEDDVRSRILEEVESAIGDDGGRIEHRQEWGRRPLTFRINHQGEAEYHLLQFSGSTSLLESLSHSLRIADGVLRFRIIKVIPGTPPVPEAAPPLVGVASSGSGAPAPAGPEDPDSYATP